MKLKKSIHVNILLVSPFVIAAPIMAYKAIGDLSRFGFLAVMILVLMFQYFKYQYDLYKHFVAIEDDRLKVKNGSNRIEIDTCSIKKIEYSDHMMKVETEGIEYQLNFAGYDVLKTEAFIEQLKTKIVDHLPVQGEAQNPRCP